MRLGHLTHVPGDDPARAYREAVDLAVRAEVFGLDSQADTRGAPGPLRPDGTRAAGHGYRSPRPVLRSR